ncbi:MAG: SH3 domain-containing protein [Balneolaceae bacterium]
MISTLVTLSVEAQQVRFDQANELLEQNQAGEALELYRSIEAGGQYSGELFYNMGIAAIHQDSLGLAKYYFLRSSGYSVIRNDAEEALRYVNNQFSRRSATLPALPWERFFLWLDGLFGPDGLLTFGMILFNTGIAGVIASWFYPRFGRLLFRGGQSVIILSLLLAATSFYLHYLDNRFDRGVLTDRQATVYEQPSTESALISTAYEGYVMKVDRHRSEPEESWYYIRLENGMYGWINREHLLTF